MADNDVTIQSPTGEEKVVPKAALPFFVNQNWVALTADGRKNTRATDKAAGHTDKS
ncbi:hypothetical protein [Geodermatophilus sp. DSM 45219]|uniref:hypothetical protein n=1 Tax=Geodermatophilus sp. DSM 45219 TaxID=1881103 RepID=UPI0008815F3B|nr:hypothetical protein [Geodermatophilus sp. DSM 45219]SDN79102.1 hypothetical protein SAMN05428965_1640 [Geodermatophilus sp. DSM 45219]